MAGKAASGTFLFATGAMLALSGFALIGFAPFLFLLGFPLIIVGGIVWIQAKLKARGLKDGANLQRLLSNTLSPRKVSSFETSLLEVRVLLH